MTDSPKTLSEHRCFGGTLRFLEHDARTIGLPMRFSVFLPPQAANGPVPAVMYLAGLTCNEETFMVKAGAQRLAAELGLAVIAPDTSPRGPAVEEIEGATASWDFGVGAGFYLDATEAPWSKHYRMYSYVTSELPALIDGHFPADAKRQGIFGHSMGGHGALTIGLRNPANRYRSISAFAPIAAPKEVPWGQKAFTNYLGPDQSGWDQYDATELMKTLGDASARPTILIDQGLADQFLENQLHPHRFEDACREAGQALTLRRQPGYDHGYYFISSFMDDHLRHHARILG
jgi:S-formylglutathione hydrolase